MANFNTIREVTTAELSDIMMLRKDGKDVGVLLSSVVSLSMPIGSTYMTVDPSFTPSGYGYLGTWELVPAGARIVSATDPLETLGSIAGTDEKPVVLKRHNHVATASTTGAHQHSIETSQILYDNFYKKEDNTEDHVAAPITTPLSTSGDHSHVVFVSTEGEEDPTINVTGRRFNVCVWKRTA